MQWMLFTDQEMRSFLSLIVVTKRITTQTEDPRNEVNNPEPGTVVDDDITCPEK